MLQNTTATITRKCRIFSNIFQNKSSPSFLNQIQEQLLYVNIRHFTVTKSNLAANTDSSSTSTSTPSPSSSSLSSSTTTSSSDSTNTATPSSSSSSSSTTPNDSLHSTDIAYKPTKDGWGYNPQYSRSWDAVFSSQKQQNDFENETDKFENGVATVTEANDSGASNGNNKRLERIVNDVLLLSKKDQMHVVELLSEKLGLKK